MEKNTKNVLMIGGAFFALYLLLRNRKDTTLIIEKQGGTVFVPTPTAPSVSTTPASSPSVTTSGSTTGGGTGALTTSDLTKTTTTPSSTSTGAGSGSATGASTGGVKQDTSSASIPTGGITGVDTPTGGGQVQDYARTSTATAGGNVVVGFDGFMYSSNGKKLTLNNLIQN